MRLVCNIFLMVWVMVSFLPVVVSAQDSTHVITVKDVTPKESLAKKLGGTFTAAPHYSSEMGLGVALAFSSKAGFSVIGNISTEGYALLGINGMHNIGDTKWRLSYNAAYSFLPTYFWGAGYVDASRNENRTAYDKKQFNVEMDALYRFSQHFSAGPVAGYSRIGWDDFPSGSKTVSEALKYGAAAYFDTRSSSVNPTDGVYMFLKQTNYAGFSSKPHFGTEILFDFYRNVWSGGILAFDMNAVFTYGEVPYIMLPTIGGPYRMRGYYYGRYRDNNAVSGQLELRQQVWEMFGAAVWVGAANLWGEYDKFDIRHSLPNCGVGLRWVLNGNIRLRFDYGFGKDGQNGFVFSINEAF